MWTAPPFLSFSCFVSEWWKIKVRFFFVLTMAFNCLVYQKKDGKTFGGSFQISSQGFNSVDVWVWQNLNFLASVGNIKAKNWFHWLYWEQSSINSAHLQWADWPLKERGSELRTKAVSQSRMTWYPSFFSSAPISIIFLKESWILFRLSSLNLMENCCSSPIWRYTCDLANDRHYIALSTLITSFNSLLAVC